MLSVSRTKQYGHLRQGGLKYGMACGYGPYCRRQVKGAISTYTTLLCNSAGSDELPPFLRDLRSVSFPERTANIE
jgi:hypothetical protein